MRTPSMIATEDVPEAFDSAAPRYDLMVALNPGYHRHLRSAAAALAERLAPVETTRIVDLGCGSGASTRALVQQFGQSRLDVVGIDASSGMLKQAEAKPWPAGVRFVHGLAEELAWSRGDWGLSDPVDGVFAAYLFRNVTERDKVLAAVHDLLVPGGVLVTQEYSVAGSRLAQWIWTVVCWLVVIPLSWLTSRESRLYRYLWRSVQRFDSVDSFTDRMSAAGYVDVEVRTVPGWQRGILHTFRARKPAEQGPSGPVMDEPARGA
ncbi:class I SAM-dependent methyltransferase [Microlunatus panaciterrae]|uniref:Ubiquinone/menaquinone biosynthesis C-methylase UbiE n=1 Tax=Microlunatus panaciterrae TaxID=400768 RepID=A0ABS2RGM1_9ACTN|nr:class I SAM-dependent methyltransferase [Microlunatus panaciterrae]MBM7798146.1 ubiquinone/menaquinone biosynthesis C-methylase UbiE [Microlunatus panaciterrae]